MPVSMLRLFFLPFAPRRIFAGNFIKINRCNVWRKGDWSIGDRGMCPLVLRVRNDESAAKNDWGCSGYGIQSGKTPYLE